ncbi:MAG: hypothetical protein SGJ01_07870, partial [Gemmatimonadota bacterium]|nr:hypothetical protein [Gemmatimonadota bacterium]
MSVRAVAAYASLVLLNPPAMPAQSPTGMEAGLISALAAADPAFIGGGASVAWRPGDRLRLVAAGMLGGQGGRTTGRGEISLNYLLEPARAEGIGVYGFAGIAGTTGTVGNGYLLLGVGVESAPGSAHGWL